MESLRKPFQGIGNIVHFNWHFYLIAILFIGLGLLISNLVLNDFQLIINLFLGLIVLNLIISLLVSWYIYDQSELYQFHFLDELNSPEKILNINAGFDETSEIIHQKFPDAELTVFDFYDEKLHTEISINRARKAYPSYPKTIQVKTHHLPETKCKFDLIVNILSAHEIRNPEERIQFFSEQNRVLKPDGKIIVTEHLRDFPNFLAYTIGFFHFHSHKTWLKTFSEAELIIEKEIKITPFISTFILTKNGTSP